MYITLLWISVHREPDYLGSNQLEVQKQNDKSTDSHKCPRVQQFNPRMQNTLKTCVAKRFKLRKLQGRGGKSVKGTDGTKPLRRLTGTGGANVLVSRRSMKWDGFPYPTLLGKEFFSIYNLSGRTARKHAPPRTDAPIFHPIISHITAPLISSRKPDSTSRTLRRMI